MFNKAQPFKAVLHYCNCNVQLLEEVKRMTNVDFHEKVVNFFQREAVDKILSHVMMMNTRKAGIPVFISEGTDANVSSK